MSECTHNCETCGQNCSDRKAESLLAPQHALSNVKKVIAVVSGKGGVGKSLVTSMLAGQSQRTEQKTAILDADITGPSIPKTFRITEKATGSADGSIYPVLTKTGIEIMSVNLLLPDETDPGVWRGPVIAGAVKQFWSEGVWNDVDCMCVDCPPGTGDVPLTVFQSLPVDGIIVVTTPQDLVSMIVGKAVKMAQLMNVPVLGLVENMSYFQCDKCGEKHEIFGKSQVEKVAQEYGIEHVARIPLDPNLTSNVDNGLLELFAGVWLVSLSDAIDSLKK